MFFWRKYPRNLKVLLLSMTINSTGMAFLWPLHTIYITHYMGRSLSEAGFVLMLHSGAEVIGSFLGGYLYDRIRGKRTLLAALITSALMLLVISIGLPWMVYTISMVLLGLGIGTIFPPIYAMAGMVWKEGGRESFNLLYLVVNLGVAIGTAFGGFVAQFSFRYVFWINGLTYLVFLLIIWFTLEEPDAVAVEGPTSVAKRKTRKQHPASFQSFIILCLAFMFCWITYIQWQTSISAYMQKLGFSLSSYSTLWTINGIIILAGQPLLQRGMARLGVAMKWQLVLGVGMFMTAFALLANFDTYSGFVAAMVVMTLGEILIFPAVPAIADQLSPHGKRGMYQGLVNGSANIGRTIGPLFGGLLYDCLGPFALLYSCILICCFALAGFATYQKLLLTKPKLKRFG